MARKLVRSSIVQGLPVSLSLQQSLSFGVADPMVVVSKTQVPLSEPTRRLRLIDMLVSGVWHIMQDFLKRSELCFSSYDAEGNELLVVVTSADDEEDRAVSDLLLVASFFWSSNLLNGCASCASHFADFISLL